MNRLGVFVSAYSLITLFTLLAGGSARASDSCYPDISTYPLFTHSPIDPAVISSIRPIGDTELLGHIRPKWKPYFYFTDVGTASSNYHDLHAMARAQVTQIQKQSGSPTYEVTIQYTCSVMTIHQGVYSISSGLESALDIVTSGWRSQSSFNYSLAGIAGSELTAGQTFGQVVADYEYFAIPTLDSRRIRGTLLNPNKTRYDGFTGSFGHHTKNQMFMADMSSTLKATWDAKLPAGNSTYGGTAWDMPGALRGVWFHPDMVNGGTNFDADAGALSFVPDQTTASQTGITWAGTGDMNMNASYVSLDPTNWTACTATDGAGDRACEILGYKPSGYSRPQNGFHWAMATNSSGTVNLNPALVGSDVATTVCYNLRHDIPSGGGSMTVTDSLLVYHPGRHPDSPDFSTDEIWVKYYPYYASRYDVTSDPIDAATNPLDACGKFPGLAAGTYPTVDTSTSSSWKKFQRNFEQNDFTLGGPPVNLAEVSKIYPPGRLFPNSDGGRPSQMHSIEFLACNSSPCQHEAKAMAAGKVFFIFYMHFGGDTSYEIYIGHKGLPTGFTPSMDPGLVSVVSGLTDISTVISNGISGASWISIFTGNMEAIGTGDGAWILPLGLNFSGPGSAISVSTGEVLGALTVTGSQYANLRFGLINQGNTEGAFTNPSIYRYPDLMQQIKYHLTTNLPGSDIASMGFPQYNFLGNSFLHSQCLHKYFSPTDQAYWSAKDIHHECHPGGFDRPGRLTGVWFHPTLDNAPEHVFNAGTGSLGIIPYDIGTSGNHQYLVQIGWGNKNAHNGPPGAVSGETLALLDPLNWPECTQQVVGGVLESVAAANARCLGTNQRPIGYDAGSERLANGFGVTPSNSTTVNPSPGKVQVGDIVCYDLNYTSGGSQYFDYVFFYLKSEGELGALYMPAKAATAQCSTQASSPPATTSPYWQYYVR